jgi:hypothetical protein
MSKLVNLLFLARLAAVLSLLPAHALAQKPLPADTFRRTLTVQLDLAAQSLSLLNDTIVQSTATPNRLVSVAPEIRQGDLILTCALAPVRDGEYYDLRLEIAESGGTFDAAPENLQGLGIDRSGGSLREIRWINLLESYINVADTLALTVTAIYYRIPYDCAGAPKERPEFKATPLVVAGAAAAGMIGLGQLFRARSRDLYDNRYAVLLDGEEAEPFYQKANRKHHAYLVLTYAGVALLSADAAWGVIKGLEFRRQRRLYDACAGYTELRLRPAVDLAPGGDGAYAGMHFRFTF